MALPPGNWGQNGREGPAELQGLGSGRASAERPRGQPRSPIGPKSGFGEKGREGGLDRCKKWRKTACNGLLYKRENSEMCGFATDEGPCDRQPVLPCGNRPCACGRCGESCPVTGVCAIHGVGIGFDSCFKGWKQYRCVLRLAPWVPTCYIDEMSRSPLLSLLLEVNVTKR